MGQLVFDFGVAVHSEYKEEHLGTAVDHYGEEKAGAPLHETILPYGFLARPLDPDMSGGSPTQGCTLLVGRLGEERVVMPLGDPRVAPKLPKVRKGGSGIYGGAGEYVSFILIDGLDPNGIQTPGSITIGASYAKGGQKQSHGLSFNVRTPGDEAVNLLHGEGHGLSIGMSAGRQAMLHNADGNAFVSAHDKGVTIAGKTKVQGSVTVGLQEIADQVVLLKPLLAYLQALEAKIAASPVGPPPVPIASIEKVLGAKHLKST